MKNQIQISIIIVSYNTKNLLQNCLNSIYKGRPSLKFEVIVVDNNSKDSSSTMVEAKFKYVKLIQNKKNKFLSIAFNQALKIAKGQYYLILNSDTIISQKAIYKMVQFMQKNEKTGLASTRQVDQNGKTDTTCSTSPTPLVEFFQSTQIGRTLQKTLPLRMVNNQVKNHHYSSWSRKTTRRVDIVPASFLIIRRNVIKKIGNFDENYLLFYQDTDICIRANDAGFDIYHLGNVKITHLRSKSLEKLPQKEVRRIALSDSLYFWRKHFGFAIWLLLLLATAPEWLVLRLKSNG